MAVTKIPYRGEGFIEVHSHDFDSEILAICFEDGVGKARVIADDENGLKLIRYIGRKVFVDGFIEAEPDLAVLTVREFSVLNQRILEPTVPKVQLRNSEFASA